MDYRGWYNRKELKANEVIDIVHVSAMGPPGGGRTEISGRLRRHYNTLAAADMSYECDQSKNDDGPPDLPFLNLGCFGNVRIVF